METPLMADATTAIPALETLIETALGRKDTATAQADIALAGTLLQTLVPVIVARAAPNLDLAGIDAALTKVLTGITDLKTAIETKPATASATSAATPAPEKVEAPRPVVPGQPLR
ncbi:hypothetical protein CFR75_05985 [Komagataeibacter xylinus]|uniref:Uncharacterized protein n=2 Tax=Komagataeibacter xylinus TaxID=28448 RepID=A0A318PJ02_KOMXY|nr:hypothetical protein CFR75_05985 [Komagataeibacter xylinus]GBQ80571.1 hypothetical protein AA15237_3017 [Komagataeibacter xylinus NBRC 15237]